MTDAEFDKLHGGRELCPIEQLAYEKEGAARFALLHGRGKASEAARKEQWGQWTKGSEPE